MKTKKDFNELQDKFIKELDDLSSQDSPFKQAAIEGLTKIYELDLSRYFGYNAGYKAAMKSLNKGQ